ncbi:MAG TPA: PA2169 family four-helix-bundle protein [Chitinophagaceae bacterium]|nr:PA2169 family four-helix-bundle protein [Chitinophagaceae bacterium]
MRNTEVLNDLIRINHDRVEGYEKAASQTKEEDLRSIFQNMSDQSRQFAGELERVVRQEGADPADGTTNSGKIYRTWMDVKATFGGDDRKGILASCEFGEDAAQTAYRTALKDDDLDAPVRTIIETQQTSLKDAHDKIKLMRDAAPR